MKRRLRNKIKKKLAELKHEYESHEHLTFVEALEMIQKKCTQKTRITLEETFHILSGRGYPALMVLLALPFFIPIQIPGLSTPFGIILAYIGLRMAFGKKIWWPQWILKREVKTDIMHGLAGKTLSLFKRIQKVLRPRYSFLIWEPFKYAHGFTVFIFALVLSLPLPIPFTNFLAALPIVLFGIGMIEDDGLLILSAYLVSLISITFFIGLFLIGNTLLATHF